jgi:hypothetical protein
MNFVGICRQTERFLTPLAASVALVMLAAFSLQAVAQTNSAPVFATNFVAAVPWFREVNGKLYNTEQSVLFKNLEGKCLKVGTNGLLIGLQEPIWGRMDSLPSWQDGDEYMGMNPSQQVRVGDRDTGKVIVLKNYFQTENPAVTQELSFKAMQTGTINYNGDILELWDCGMPHVVMVVTTNCPTGFKVERGNQ